MINRITSLFFFFLFSISFTSAQLYDIVSIGKDYTQQTYYKISTGETVSVNNDIWDICFSAAGQQDGGVFINESASSTGTPIKLFLSPTSNWSESITNTDQFVDTIALYNLDQNWIEGAFNTVKNPNSPFDYGWGAYNPQNHNVEGNKIFVIKLRNGTFKKFQVVALTGITYSFKYANLDGSNEIEKSVTKGSLPLIYFSFKTNDVVQMPTDYDLIFMRYSTITTAPNDPSISLEYSVTGVLSGPGVQVAKADSINVYDVKEEDYADKYVSSPLAIGHDWKNFDFTQGWVIPSDLSYFVKTKNGDKYQLIFLDFEGAGTGNIALEKKYLGTTSSIDFSENLNINVYPNPCIDHIQLSQDGNLRMYDVLGKLVLNTSIVSNEKVDVSNLPNGNYCYIFTTNEGLTSSGKIIK